MFVAGLVMGNSLALTGKVAGTLNGRELKIKLDLSRAEQPYRGTSATGRTGEAVAPRIFSGSAMNRNS